MKKNLFLSFLFSLSSLLLFAQTEKIEAVSHVTVNFSEIASKFAETPEEIRIPDLSGKKSKIIPLPRELNINEKTSVYDGPPYSPKDIGNAINVVSPAPSLNFTGFIDNIASIPPDVHGAVGPNHVMTTLNPAVVIHNKTTGAVISSVSLNAFWASLNGGGFTVGTFDPKVYYDPYSNRWIFVVCSNGNSANSSLLIAISVNTDPTGTWDLYRYDVDATNVNWFDYPSCGYNKNWFVVTGNMFSISGGTFANSKVYVFNKTDLYNSGTLTPTIFTDAVGFTIVPAETFDNSINTLYLIDEYSGTGTWRISQITGTEVSPAYSLIGNVSIGASNAYSYTSGATNSSSLPQSGSANKISSNDARMQNVVYRNGFLWAAQSVFKGTIVPKPAAAQWLKFNISPSVTLNSFGRIDDATNTFQFAYPSISVNANNDALIGYSMFSAGQFAGAAYSYRSSADAVGTMRDSYQYKNGEASYFKTYGGTRNRWGDYSVVAIDPSNDLDFWTQQEFASTFNGTYDRWATQWAKVSIPLPNSITISSLPSLTLCANKAYNLPFTIAGTYNAGNQFVAQISDNAGSFTSPLGIGTLTSIAAGSISGTVPNSVTPGGVGYKLRVVSTNPVLTSTNEYNVTIIPQTRSIGTSTVAPYEATEYISNSGSLAISGTKEYKAGKAITFTPSTGVTIGTTPSTVFTVRIVTCPY